MGGNAVSRSWVQGCFARYYAEHPISLPYAAARREFGYGSQSKIERRHTGFADDGEFNAFLQNQSPLYVSASVSEYVFPTLQPMEKKQWVGGDLIYEFDADDIPTPCKTQHDAWECPACGEQGKGRVAKCTQCGKGTQLEEWVCGECVRATKEKTNNLIRLLQDDWGFDWGKTIFVNFSGSKGYHVHVRSPHIFSLPKSARIELMDYVSFHEMDVSSLGFFFDGKQYHCPLPARAKGHASRILDELRALLLHADETEWSILSHSSPRAIRTFLNDRSLLLRDVHAGILPVLPGKKTEPFWDAVLAALVDRLRLPIDRQCSSDIPRLMRVPNTLHGSTGLLAQYLSEEEFEG
ncbi:MAG: DNA primase small subunit domain-containing protein, partial [archaeon]|nr:DNA primase small subunit domain-containing protein [archaeon]